MPFITASLNYLCNLIGGEGPCYEALPTEPNEKGTGRFSQLDEWIDNPSLAPRLLAVIEMVEKGRESCGAVVQALERRIEARRLTSFDAEAAKCLLLWVATISEASPFHAQMGDLYSTVLNGQKAGSRALARRNFPEHAPWGSGLTTLLKKEEFKVLEGFHDLERWILSEPGQSDLVQLVKALKAEWKREILFAPMRSLVIEELLAGCVRSGAEIAAEILRKREPPRSSRLPRQAEAKAALLRLGANEPTVFSTTFLGSRILKIKIREAWERFLDGRELRRSVSELRELAGISQGVRNVNWATQLTLLIKRYSKSEKRSSQHVYQAEKELLSLIRQYGGDEARSAAETTLHQMVAEELDPAAQTVNLYLWKTFKCLDPALSVPVDEGDGTEVEIRSAEESDSSSDTDFDSETSSEA